MLDMMLLLNGFRKFIKVSNDWTLYFKPYPLRHYYLGV